MEWELGYELSYNDYEFKYWITEMKERFDKCTVLNDKFVELYDEWVFGIRKQPL